MVNRIWQYHFGRGIVATPNDFGRMGERPSNPELLDYLANEFVASGWSMKPMQRMILLSEHVSAGVRSRHESRHGKDPDNRCCGDSTGDAWKRKRSAIPCSPCPAR